MRIVLMNVAWKRKLPPGPVPPNCCPRRFVDFDTEARVESGRLKSEIESTGSSEQRQHGRASHRASHQCPFRCLAHFQHPATLMLRHERPPPFSLGSNAPKPAVTQVWAFVRLDGRS